MCESARREPLDEELAREPTDRVPRSHWHAGVGCGVELVTDIYPSGLVADVDADIPLVGDGLRYQYATYRHQHEG